MRGIQHSALFILENAYSLQSKYHITLKQDATGVFRLLQLKGIKGHFQRMSNEW